MKRRSANALLPDTQNQFEREHLIDESVSHLLPIKVSPVFDTYWRFAAERQNVYLASPRVFPCTCSALMSPAQMMTAVPC